MPLVLEHDSNIKLGSGCKFLLGSYGVLNVYTNNVGEPDFGTLSEGIHFGHADQIIFEVDLFDKGNKTGRLTKIDNQTLEQVREHILESFRNTGIALMEPLSTKIRPKSKMEISSNGSARNNTIGTIFTLQLSLPLSQYNVARPVAAELKKELIALLIKRGAYRPTPATPT